jgi:hypothetical protein
MNVLTTLFVFLLLTVFSFPQDGKLPIIDMHMHCYDSTNYFTAPDLYGKMSAENPDEHFKQNYNLMKKYKIVKAVISGTFSAGDNWVSKDTDKRFIRGLVVESPAELDIAEFEDMIKDGKLEVFGEIGAIYKGYTLSDPEFEPYLRICEKYDIPVAVHTGGGPPEVTYIERFANFRLALGDPLVIEDALVKFPNLRIYMMHAGEVFYENAVRLMLLYPQLYTDLGVLLWVHPLVKSYVVDFLKRAKEAGMLDRVMFGSDQMVWPHGIEMSIEFLNSLDFLTEKEKRDIFYNNAVRFLRLEGGD